MLIFQNKDHQHIFIKPLSGIYFPGIDFIRNQVSRALIATNYSVPIVVDCSKISTLDFTSLKGMTDLIGDFQKLNLHVTFLDLDENLERKLNLEKQQNFKIVRTLAK